MYKPQTLAQISQEDDNLSYFAAVHALRNYRKGMRGKVRARIKVAMGNEWSEWAVY